MNEPTLFIAQQIESSEFKIPDPDPIYVVRAYRGRAWQIHRLTFPSAGGAQEYIDRLPWGWSNAQIWRIG
jgi:hypothetical protein